MKEVDFLHKSIGPSESKCAQPLTEEEKRRKRDLEKAEKGDPTETDIFK